MKLVANLWARGLNTLDNAHVSIIEIRSGKIWIHSHNGRKTLISIQGPYKTNIHMIFHLGPNVSCCLVFF